MSDIGSTGWFCLEGLAKNASVISRLVLFTGLVPSVDGPEMICSQPIPAALCQIVTMPFPHSRHIGGISCPSWTILEHIR